MPRPSPVPPPTMSDVQRVLHDEMAESYGNTCRASPLTAPAAHWSHR